MSVSHKCSPQMRFLLGDFSEFAGPSEGLRFWQSVVVGSMSGAQNAGTSQMPP